MFEGWGAAGTGAGAGEQPRGVKRSAGVLMGLLAWQSLCQPSGHTVTLGACDKLAAKSLCDGEAEVGFELGSLWLWQGGTGALPGQGWDPASPVILTISPFSEELLVLVLPSHKLCSAASLLSGDRRPCRSSSSK